MTKEAILNDLLEKHGIELTGPIVSDQAVEGGSLAFIRSSLTKDGKRVPTSYTLKRITAWLEEIGLTINFIRVEGDNTDLDGSLKIMLLGRYGSLLRNSFASFHHNKAEIWIEPKVPLQQVDEKEITAKVTAFFDLVGFEIANISFTSLETLPSSTALIRTLRTLAPCDLPALKLALQAKGFCTLNEVWLNHSLDKIRKQGHVIRRKDGKYFLSLQALNLLGTEKNSNSPDVARALALPRRDK